MHAFVISYVWTVLRVLSKYSLACWFGQMLTKAISWMKSSIASPTLRGVPVSLVRPWIWSLFYIRFRYQINSSSLTSTLDEMIDLESCISLPVVFLHHRPIIESVVCLHTTVSCPPLCIIIGVSVLNCWAPSAQPCNIFYATGLLYQEFVYQWGGFLSYWTQKIGFSINIFIGKPVVTEYPWGTLLETRKFLLEIVEFGIRERT